MADIVEKGILPDVFMLFGGFSAAGLAATSTRALLKLWLGTQANATRR
jgi:hypothetical protein